MENKTKVDPQALLDSLRGNGDICFCGKKLVKIRFGKNNEYGGVQHETIEDEDYHYGYGAGHSVKLIDPQP